MAQNMNLLQCQIDAAKRQIDEFVRRLYNLSDDESKIVEMV